MTMKRFFIVGSNRVCEERGKVWARACMGRRFKGPERGGFAKALLFLFCSNQISTHITHNRGDLMELTLLATHGFALILSGSGPGAGFYGRLRKKFTKNFVLAFMQLLHFPDFSSSSLFSTLFSKAFRREESQTKLFNRESESTSRKCLHPARFQVHF
jgi:hypothetical protein